MPIPVEIDLTRTRGDTFANVFAITDSTGAVVDITGFTFRLSVDVNPAPIDAATQLFQIIGVVTDGPNGKVSFTPSLVEADQSPNVYFYDIQMVDLGPLLTTIAKGQWAVSQDITKETT